MEETRTNVVEMTTEKAYTLRNLEAKDVFIMSKILSQIGLKEFKEVFDLKLFSSEEKDSEEKGSEEKDIEAVGMAVFFDMSQVLFANLPKCENDIYSFLASLSDIEVKEIESLPMNTFIEMVIDVFRKEEFTDFFKLVSKLFK